MTEPKKRPWFLDYDARVCNAISFYLTRFAPIRRAPTRRDGVWGDFTLGSPHAVVQDTAAPAATFDLLTHFPSGFWEIRGWGNTETGSACGWL